MNVCFEECEECEEYEEYEEYIYEKSSLLNDFVNSITQEFELNMEIYLEQNLLIELLVNNELKISFNDNNFYIRDINNFNADNELYKDNFIIFMNLIFNCDTIDKFNKFFQESFPSIVIPTHDSPLRTKDIKFIKDIKDDNNNNIYSICLNIYLQKNNLKKIYNILKIITYDKYCPICFNSKCSGIVCESEICKHIFTSKYHTIINQIKICNKKLIIFLFLQSFNSPHAKELLIPYPTICENFEQYIEIKNIITNFKQLFIKDSDDFNIKIINEINQLYYQKMGFEYKLEKRNYILFFLTHALVKINNKITEIFEHPYSKYKCFDLNIDECYTNRNNSFLKKIKPRSEKHIKIIDVFHGSKDNNWFSIIIHGLINLSDTKYMKHGKIHGNGIYLGETIDVSAAYGNIIGEFEAIRSQCEFKCNGIYLLNDDTSIRLKRLYISNKHPFFIYN